MATKNASPSLKAFFEGEWKKDPNTTLEEARVELARLSDPGPEDVSATQTRDLAVEIEELIERHDEHTPVSDFL